MPKKYALGIGYREVEEIDDFVDHILGLLVSLRQNLSQAKEHLGDLAMAL